MPRCRKDIPQGRAHGALFRAEREECLFREQGFRIAYATMNAHRSNLREANGRRSMVIQEVRSVKDAVGILRQISELQAA